MDRRPLPLCAAVAISCLLFGCGSSTSVSRDADIEGTADGRPDSDPDGCNRGTYDGSFSLWYSDPVEPLFGYTAISGTLEIADSFVTSLEGLECLETIHGNLWIGCNPDLQNLDGLNGLTSVGGYLVVNCSGEDPTALQNIDALANVVSVGDALAISSNPYLLSIDGLSGVRLI